MNRLRFDGRRRMVLLLAGSACIGALGVYLQLHSHASTPRKSFEGEKGKLSAGALLSTDTSASGGKEVKFGTPLAQVKADVAYDSLPVKSTMQATMAQVADNKSIGFSAKRYQLVDFLPDTALTESQSMIGAGIDKTIIQLKPDSSTQQGRDNRGYVGQGSDGVTCPLRMISSGGSLIQDLTIQGSLQGSNKKGDNLGIYHGMRLTGTNPVVRRVKVANITGAGQANPQETFSISWNHVDNVTIDSVKVDGGGVAASLIGSNRSSNAKVMNTEVYNMTIANAFAWFTSTNGTFSNVYVHDVKRAFNFERQSGTVTIDHAKLRNITGGNDINIANDQGSSVFNIIDPDNNGKPLRIHIGGYWGGARKQQKADVHVIVNGKDVSNNSAYVTWIITG